MHPAGAHPLPSTPAPNSRTTYTCQNGVHQRGWIQGVAGLEYLRYPLVYARHSQLTLVLEGVFDELRVGERWFLWPACFAVVGFGFRPGGFGFGFGVGFGVNQWSGRVGWFIRSFIRRRWGCGSSSAAVASIGGRRHTANGERTNREIYKEYADIRKSDIVYKINI